MSFNVLTPSINRLSGSSTAALPNASIKLWDRAPFLPFEVLDRKTEGCASLVSVIVDQCAGTPPAFIGSYVLTYPQAFDHAETWKNRLLCHALIQRLQDRGLPEAVEQLSELVGFYDNPPPPYRVLSPGQPVRATLGPTIVRPVYPVTEED